MKEHIWIQSHDHNIDGVELASINTPKLHSPIKITESQINLVTLGSLDLCVV